MTGSPPTDPGPDDPDPGPDGADPMPDSTDPGPDGTIPEPDVAPAGRAGAPTPAPFAADALGVDRLATILQRFLARLVDVLVIGAPVILLVLMTSDIDEAEGVVRTPLWAQLLSTAAAALYEIVLIRQRGQTVGKRALNIKVVRVTDGQPPDWTASIMRYLLPILPALIPIPGLFLLSPVIYLAAMFDPLRRGWHDRAAGTIVVKTDPPSAAEPPPPPP